MDVVDITLVLSKYPTPFYCIRCKCPMFVHHNGLVVSGKVNPPLPGRCGCPNQLCKLEFNFQGFIHNVGGATKNITISLHRQPDAEISSFHCYECRTTVFQYLGDLMDIVPGKTTGTPIVVSKCSDSQCGIKYSVYEF